MDINKLRSIIQEKKPNITEIDWGTQLTQWKKQIDNLYNMIKPWIVDIGNTKICLQKKTIHEEMLGTYNVEILVATINQSEIKFDPVGSVIVGAWGRVDVMNSLYIKRTLLLVPKQTSGIEIKVTIANKDEPSTDNSKSANIDKMAWKVLEETKLELTTLTKELFYDIIAEMVQ